MRAHPRSTIIKDKHKRNRDLVEVIEIIGGCTRMKGIAVIITIN